MAVIGDGMLLMGRGKQGTEVGDASSRHWSVLRVKVFQSNCRVRSATLVIEAMLYSTLVVRYGLSKYDRG